MNPAFKKAFKYVVIVLFVLIISGFIFIVQLLPSQKQIAKFLKSPPLKSNLQRGNSTDPPANATVNAPSTASELKTEPPAVASAQTSEDQSKKEKQKANEQLIRKFLDEDINDIRVCENLGRTTYFEKRKTLRAGQNMDFEDFFSEDQRDDSVAETFRYPIKAVLQSTGLAELLKELFDYETANLSDDEKSSLLDKIGFYARAANVAADLYRNKDDYELLGNRSAHLGVLAKIAALKPELSSDPIFKSHCEELQASIRNHEKIDIKKERSEIIKLIESSGLSNKQLDFDPNSYIKFNLVNSEKGINFNMTDKGAAETTNNQ